MYILTNRRAELLKGDKEELFPPLTRHILHAESSPQNAEPGRDVMLRASIKLSVEFNGIEA